MIPLLDTASTRAPSAGATTPADHRLVRRPDSQAGEKRERSISVSVVIRDGRGFTHFYEDFVTSPEAAARALEALAATHASDTEPRPVRTRSTSPR